MGETTYELLPERLLYLSAYRKVLRVCSHDPEFGEMHDIITVRESPTNESLRTSVNLLPLKGM